MKEVVRTSDYVRKGSVMSSGILLSFTALAGFSSSTREELLAYVSSQANLDEKVAPETASEEEDPADLSYAQVKKFLERCSEKTTEALKVIAKADPSGFTMEAVAEALNVDLDEGDLRGVWGGLTKRVRTVLGDPQALLIWWTPYGDDQWRGRVSAMTHRSLRKAFGL